MLKHNYLYSFVSRFAASYGILFGWICLAFVLFAGFNHEQSNALACSVTYFLVALILGWNAKTFGLSVLVFILPLVPTLNIQISSVMPAMQFPVVLTGTRLVAGFVCGVFIKQMTIGRISSVFYKLPGVINLACVVLTCSTAIAISRNMWMSGTTFTFKGLLFNATHYTINGWLDDYYPLTDLLMYGLAAVLIACIIHTLKDETAPIIKIIKPILWGVIVAAGWAMIQNRTGYGLSYSSASGNRYYQMFGYASTGFQPDIHAFSAHMLLGAVGAWGCFYIKKEQLSRWLIVSAILMGWIGLWASKSRGSILLASIIYVIVFGIMLWRKNKLHFFIATTGVLFALSTTYVFHRWGLSIIPLWLIQYSESLPKLNVNNLEALNAHFGNRAEIYHAAIRMFQAFPLMGIGQGDFYRMSGIQEFAKSRFLGQIQGENAHNYFLQVLTETGLIGAVVLALVFIVPWLKNQDRKNMLPVYAMILSIGLGNLFAHALLVRENLFLLCTLIGLLYALIKHQSKQQSTEKYIPYLKYVLFAVSILIVVLSVKEVSRSFEKFPYAYGSKCYVSREVQNSEWTSGLIDLSIPDGVSKIELNLKDTQPGVNLKPLGLELTLLDKNARILDVQQQSIKSTGPQTVTFEVGTSMQNNAMPTRAIVKLSKCFIPRNIGMNTDSRVLGILIKDVQFIK